MSAIRSKSVRMAVAGIGMAAALSLTGSAYAQEHRARRHQIEPYRAKHWIYDDRYHHGHYYPAIGYSVSVLPPGYISLSFGNRRFFFEGGVWFAPAAGAFAVVRPPVGIVVPRLPPGYTTVWIAGVPYYYANDIYYAAAPGGYVVSAPSAVTTYTEAPPPAAPAVQAPPAAPPPPTSASAQPSVGMWYYCESSKAYYPYVSECKEAWRQVPATPPQPR